MHNENSCEPCVTRGGKAQASRMTVMSCQADADSWKRTSRRQLEEKHHCCLRWTNLKLEIRTSLNEQATFGEHDDWTLELR